MIITGYGEDTNIYRLLAMDTLQLMVSRDVTVVESQMAAHHANNEDSGSFLVEVNNSNDVPAEAVATFHSRPESELAVGTTSSR